MYPMPVGFDSPVASGSGQTAWPCRGRLNESFAPLGRRLFSRGAGELSGLLAFLLLGSWIARSQPAAPPVRDPLMSLMLSQPKIELATQVVATVSFDPPTVRVGQQSIYRVTFNALEESVQWPGQIMVPPQLTLEPGAHGETYLRSPGKLEPETVFNSRVRASSTGKFAVPQFTVHAFGQEVVVPPAQLEVVETAPATSSGPQLTLQFEETNLFVGQPTAVHVNLAGAQPYFNPMEGRWAEISGDGFIVDLGPQSQRLEMTPRGFGYQTTLTPAIAGKLRIFAQGFALPGGGAFRFNPMSGGQPATLLESEPIELHPRPLPREGELPGFTGAIGKFGVSEFSLGSRSLRVGDPVTLLLRITNGGGGTLTRLVPPPAPRSSDWQVVPDVTENATSPNLATFHYTLVPLAVTKATPAFPFSYFDPKAERYVDATLPPLPVKVEPAATATRQAAAPLPVSNDEPEKTPVLSELAATPGTRLGSLAPAQQQPWFVLVQLAPLAAVFGLWYWDRRRRFLEQHPEILLRRRARRALRRQWRAVREAARRGDARAFATAAVNAMRVASAPHFPAHPKALVGGDVERLLDTASGENGLSSARGAVRHLFAVTDATLFAGEQGDSAALLPLHPQIELVLQELDRRLCPEVHES